jgi:hypothetical protein
MSLLFSDHLGGLLVTPFGQVDVCLGGALGPLLETVQHLHGIADGRHVDDPVGTSIGTYPDLAAPRPQGLHRFPVGGVEVQMHQVKLVAGHATGLSGHGR